MLVSRLLHTCKSSDHRDLSTSQKNLARGQRHNTTSIAEVAESLSRVSQGLSPNRGRLTAPSSLRATIKVATDRQAITLGSSSKGLATTHLSSSRDLATAPIRSRDNQGTTRSINSDREAASEDRLLLGTTTSQGSAASAPSAVGGERPLDSDSVQLKCYFH